MHIISLGAGVQSSTMALMAVAGEILPMPACAVFADTQNEPPSVYKWLDWLELQLPFPVYRVTRGNLGEASLELRTAVKSGKTYTQHSPPAFIVDAAGRQGLMMRQCTRDFKIDVIHRKCRELKQGRPIVQWVGISLDEAHRMKPSQKKYITNRWPLIDLRMSRRNCLEWIESKGYPTPPRSACEFCAYHSDAEWRRLKTNEPESFQNAVAYERRLQVVMSQVSNFRGTPFLHRSMKPLDTVDFTDTQGNLFGNECEGMCGV